MFQFKKTSTVLSLIAVGLIAFTIACQKDAAQTTALTDEQKVAAAKKTLQASQFFTNSFTQATLASGKANGFAGDRDGVVLRGACADPTVLPADFLTFPKTVTINYGAGCTDEFGRNKSGFHH